MTLWLKMIGTWDDPWPEQRPYDLKHIGFRGKRPTGVRPGDRMILYAVGWKRIFAVADVTSGWKHNDEDGWPYCVDIRSPLEISLAPSAGVNGTDVSADLPDRVRRRSHTRLSQQEFDLAERRLREASNTA
jgi:hypothetical protein